MNTRQEHRHAHHVHEPQYDHSRRRGQRFDGGRTRPGSSPYERAEDPGAEQSGNRESGWRGDERAAGDTRYARNAAHAGFRGVGPKGYVRSDARVTEDLCDCLTDDPRIDASDVTVACVDGKVTLTGSVESRAMKHLIEDIADDILGVKEVHNRLRVAERD